MWNVTVANEDQALAISLKLPIDQLARKLHNFTVSDNRVYLTFEISFRVHLMIWYELINNKLYQVTIEYQKWSHNQRYDIHTQYECIKDWLEALNHFATQQYETWLIGAGV